MTDSFYRGFSPAGSSGLPGEIASMPINPNAPVLNAFQFVRGLLFAIQALITLLLAGCLVFHVYAAIAWNALLLQLPYLLVEICVYLCVMAGAVLLHRLNRR